MTIGTPNSYYYKLEGKTMVEVRNLDQKRVLDISEDRKEVVIRKKGCETIIRAQKDGTLAVLHRWIATPA